MWFKVDDQLHSHPKARRAGLEAMGLWVLAGAYCSAYKLDGHVDSEWIATQKRGKALAKSLVSARLWHEMGHDCEGCPQPNDERGYVFHDWEDSNPTADEVEAKRASDRERQRQRRARLNGTKPAPAEDVTPDVTPDVQRDTCVSHGTPTRPDPTRPKEEDPSTSHIASDVDDDQGKPDDNPRPEVVALCEHLAARVRQNGHDVKTVGKLWHRSCRLLLDKDGRTVEQVMAAIDWATADPFWCTNIRSMQTLREKYSTIQAQAKVKRTATTSRNGIDWNAKLAAALESRTA